MDPEIGMGALNFCNYGSDCVSWNCGLCFNCVAGMLMNIVGVKRRKGVRKEIFENGHMRGEYKRGVFLIFQGGGCHFLGDNYLWESGEDFKTRVRD